MATTNVNKLAEDMSYLRKDMAVVGALVDRLDTTIDKLTDISNSVSSLLAVHETKLTSQEIISKQLADLVEARRVETDDKIQILHERISSGERELKESIDNQYDEIASAMGVPTGTIKSRIFNARKRLMEDLKDFN